jgi:ABC-type arginine transport system ATPase subunit
VTAPSHNTSGNTARRSIASTRWSREQIRAARLAPLLHILQKHGIKTVAKEAGNYILPADPGLIFKDSYWRWPQRNLAGNAIDFHMRVLGLTFHEAMRRITAT